MLRLKTIFNILLIFLFVLSCSSSNDKPLVAPPKEKVSLPKLWGFAMDDFNEGKAEGAIEKFKMVEKDYSYTEWAPKSLLMMAYVYYEANRCVDTLSVLERYVKFYPNNPERVYVEYLKGVCYFEEVSEFSKDQEKTVKAITQFKSLINSYPNTEYADDAKYKLDLLNDLMAGKEMYVARYYMNKQKWAAAINRLKIIVDKYQTTIYIEEALYRLVEIYHKLGLEEDASKAAAILGYNFNSSEWYKKSYLLVSTNQTTLPKKDKSTPTPLDTLTPPPPPAVTALTADTKSEEQVKMNLAELISSSELPNASITKLNEDSNSLPNTTIVDHNINKISFSEVDMVKDTEGIESTMMAPKSIDHLEEMARHL